MAGGRPIQYRYLTIAQLKQNIKDYEKKEIAFDITIEELIKQKKIVHDLIQYSKNTMKQPHISTLKSDIVKFANRNVKK